MHISCRSGHFDPLRGQTRGTSVVHEQVPGVALPMPAWQGKPGPGRNSTAGTFLKKTGTVLASLDKCVTEKFPWEAASRLLPGLMEVINKKAVFVAFVPRFNPLLP